MQELKTRILEDGIAIGNDIIKVDSFINHQIDVKLLENIGYYLAKQFKGVTKVLTIEASGIAFGVSVASQLGYVPVVFAKKNQSKILDNNNLYTTDIYSFTKGVTNQVSVDKRFLSKDDKILIVDDFLADGNAALGLIDLCNQAGATVLGVAVVVEKGFQNGRRKLEEKGYKVVSGAIVEAIQDGKPVIK